ncbi:MAG: hypothetical protein F6J94_05545 [Moorea sp. SIO1F2]|uniref:condensation domain-containing protein n=1 Tax=Moorena sp. SIO1F2 TaxID=2607819 RepID=UPI0013B7EE49|nr:condensation domain-containing protein [Moorena sp. SIO1F2]NET81437.1 hypothetical protein [Moorena sp. SIO1F2]
MDDKRERLLNLLKREQKKFLPLTPAQERLWRMEQGCKGRPVYIIPGAIRFRGELNLVAFRRSLDYLVERQEVLRITFTVVQQQVLQVLTSMKAALTVLDLESFPPSQRQSLSQNYLVQELETPFDLSCGPLFRTLLLRLSSHDWIVLFNLHNIIVDGWSMGIFYEELSQVYDAFCKGLPAPLSPLRLRYQDFVRELTSEFKGTRLAEATAYWRRTFQNLPDLTLPPVRNRDLNNSHNGGSLDVRIDRTQTIALQTFAQSQRVTLFMVLLAVFSICLHRYFQVEKLVIATPTANRDRSDLEGLMGLLVNVLVLPIDLRGNPTYRTILSRIRAVTVQAYAHPQVPFNQLLPDLPFPEPDARNPLAHFLLAYHGFSLKPLAFPNLEMESLKYPIKTSRYELGLHLWENTKTHLSSTSAEHGGLSGTFFYGSARFDSVMVEQIISKFQQVLQQMIAQPDACLSEK